RSMSALGHKRTFGRRNAMSALPPIADIRIAWDYIRRSSSAAGQYSPRPAASHRPVRLALGSQTWFSFINERYTSPAALPIGAFFFEGETTGLTFVPHCWSQS